jgi:hypothetical protein
MVEVWEFIKSVWAVVDFVLSLVYMIAIPFAAIGLWKLAGRLDIFVRLEKAAKASEYKPSEYRENMNIHERALGIRESAAKPNAAGAAPAKDNSVILMTEERDSRLLDEDQ